MLADADSDPGYAVRSTLYGFLTRIGEPVELPGAGALDPGVDAQLEVELQVAKHAVLYPETDWGVGWPILAQVYAQAAEGVLVRSP